jgi:spore coat protein H
MNTANPKSEIRNPKEYRMPNPDPVGQSRQGGRFRNSSFGFLSDFGVRNSDFRRALSILLFFLEVLPIALPAAPAKPSLAYGDFEPNVPLVFLAATNQINGGTPVGCTVQIIAPKGDRYGSTVSLRARIMFHGATSQGYPKKSFKLTLEEAAPLLGLRQNAHWVLNAAFVDRSLMRHKLSYDLFRSLATTNAPRYAAGSRFAEVYLNGRYNGAYLLMERVDRQLLELRAFRSNDFSHACIYKAIDHAANFGWAGRGGYEQREPDAVAHPYWEPLEQFNRFVSRSPATNLFDPETGIATRLDLDNAIDFHLLVLLTSNSDGITKNFILARDGQEAGPQRAKFFFAPWDYDGTFGRNWNAAPYPYDVWLTNNLFERLMQDAGYRARFAARWRKLREREFSVKTIQTMIDDNVRTLGEAARRNATRWPTDTGMYPDRLTFQEDIAEMKAWVEARVKWLDQEIGRR